MITNKKHNKIINDMITDYEKLIALQEKMIAKACKRLSRDVFCEDLDKCRTADEWKESLLRECNA